MGTIKLMNWMLRIFIRPPIHGITLPPFGIYIRVGHEADQGLKEHEAVHWEQYERMGCWSYYLTYLWYQVRYGQANHPMEIEARERSGVE